MTTPGSSTPSSTSGTFRTARDAMSEASGSERSLTWLPREVRGEVEGKILQAASMGYQKGIAAGKAQTAASRSDADRREMDTLRRELEDLRSERASVAGTHVFHDAASTFSARSTPTHHAVDDRSRRRGATMPRDASFEPSPHEPFERGDGGSTPSGGHSVADTAFRPAGDERDATRPAHMPKDAGVMPEEVTLARHSGASTAPTAAMWALSVSAKAGVMPESTREALDLISSRCQLWFAHDKLARARCSAAMARWRLACQDPRYRRTAAIDACRRRGIRTMAKCFRAWCGPDATHTSAFGEQDFVRHSPAPGPAMNRKTAEGMHAELSACKAENERLGAALARQREELESRGPTPRETAQAEKFRIHLQRLQRDLESVRKERDAVRAAAGRAEREEEEAREARRIQQRSQGTQVGGSGELAVAAEDTAGVLQFELQSQAAKFHAEFERQALIAEEATTKLRNEAALRTKMEDAHRREIARLREMHVSELASVRGDHALRARMASSSVRGGSVTGGPEGHPGVAGAGRADPEFARPRSPGRPRGPTTRDIAELEREAGRMRPSERVAQKVQGWDVPADLADADLSPSDAGGGARTAPTDDDWDQQGRHLGQQRNPGGAPPARRYAPSETGSERSGRSRAGTAAQVAAALRGGGSSAVDALLRSGDFDPDDAVPRSFPGGTSARPSKSSHTMAVAQLVMRGFSRLEAVEALTALGDEDIDTAHEWLMDRRGGMAT